MAKFGKLFDLTGRTALITGAASGFGRSIAVGFAEYGCQVAVADINLARLEETVQEVCNTGVRCLPLKVDVAQPHSILETVPPKYPDRSAIIGFDPLLLAPWVGSE